MAKIIHTGALPVTDYLFGDLTAMHDQFRIAGADMASFVDARRQDMEALIHANTMAYEAMIALVKTQSEMVIAAMHASQTSTTDAARGNGGMPDPVKWTEGARDAWQKMLVDAKALTEMAQRSQGEILAGLTERAKESIAQSRQMIHAKVS